MVFRIHTRTKILTQIILVYLKQILFLFKEKLLFVLLSDEVRDQYLLTLWKHSLKNGFPVPQFTYLPLITDKRPSSVLSTRILGELNAKVAILVQGPVSSYTLESLRKYSVLFPESGVFLSTWQDSPAELIDKCRLYCNDVIFSSLPSFKGFMNINCQLISSSALSDEDLEAYEYVLKVRSDQCIHSVEALAWLVSQLRRFPKKIIVSSIGTNPFMNWHIGDHITFCRKDRYHLYWRNCPLKTPLDEKPYSSHLKWSDDIRQTYPVLPEQWLGYNYLRQLNNYQYLSQSQYIIDHFKVIDSTELLLHWNKRRPHMADIHLHEHASKYPYHSHDIDDPRLNHLQFQIIDEYKADQSISRFLR